MLQKKLCNSAVFDWRLPIQPKQVVVSMLARSSRVQVLSALTVLFSLLAFDVRAQIDGPTVVYVGDVVTYYAPVSQGSWSVLPAYRRNIISESSEMIQLEMILDGPLTVSYSAQLGQSPPPLDVNILPGIPAAPGQPAIQTDNCSLVVIQMTGTIPANTNWWWQAVPNGQSKGYGQASSLNVYTSGTWYVQSENATNGAWGETSVGRDVVVRTVPPAPSTNSISRCGPGPITLTTTPGSGASGLKWYTSGGAALQSANVNVTISTTYFAASVTADGCESTSWAAVSVTVTPIPSSGSIGLITPTQICVGSNFNVITDGSAPFLYDADYDDFEGPTGNWVSVLAESGGGADFSYPANYVGNWRVRSRSDATCGPGEWTNYVTFSVWPSPEEPTNKTYTPATVCAGQTTVRLSATPVNGNIVRWYETAGSTTPITPISGSFDVQVGPLAATRQYYATSGLNAACEGSKFPFTVTVQQLPPAPSPQSMTRCGPGSITLWTMPGSGATGLKWYTAGGSALSSATVTVTANTTYYAASLTAGGCESTARAAVSVTVLTQPTIGLTSHYQICVGSNFNVNVLGSSPSFLYDADYDEFGDPVQWVSVLAESGGGPNFSYQSQYVGNWRVRARSDASCSPADWTNYVTFSVWPSPGNPTNKTQTPGILCSNQTTVRLSATPVDGGTVKWYETAGSTTPIAPLPNSSDISVGPLAATREYFVSSVLAGVCEGEKFPMTVVVTPTPQPALPAPQICSAETTDIPLTCSNVSGATYTWTVTPGQIQGTSPQLTPVSGGSIQQILVHFDPDPQVATYTVSATKNGCTGSGNINVTVKPTPVVATSSPSLCSGGVTSIALQSTLSGATFTWVIYPGTITGASAQSTPVADGTIQQTLANNTAEVDEVTYTVHATKNGCSGAGNHVVTVTPRPVLSGVDKNIYSGQNSSLQITSAAVGTSISWSATPVGVTGAASGNLTMTGTTGLISQQISVPGASDGSVSYVISPSLNNCSSTPLTLTVGVFPVPLIVASSNVITKGNAVSLSVPGPSTVVQWYWNDVPKSTTATAQTRAPGTYYATISREGATTNTQTLAIEGPLGIQNLNYIITESSRAPDITVESNLSKMSADSVSQSIQYFDGLGRLMQTINTQGSPTNNDLVVPTVYDAMSREYRKFLPVAFDKTGRYRDVLNGVNEYEGTAASTYNGGKPFMAMDAKPFADAKIESSPLNRVIEQGAPGQDWQLGSNNTITKKYEFNDADDVLLFKYDPNSRLISLDPSAQHYTALTLVAQRTFDENKNEVIEYIDREGKVICKKVEYLRTGTPPNEVRTHACTYYIYDNLGNLVVVLPPEAVRRFTE